MLSVSVDVDPNNPFNYKKYLKIGIEYKITMADVIILVSDHDEEQMDKKSTNKNINNSECDTINEVREIYMMKENTKNKNENDRLSFNNNNNNINSIHNNNISSSRSNRPSCHRNRTESHKSQLQLLETHSTIPLINGVSLSSSSLKPCSYYRQKFIMSDDPNYWINGNILQKSAGQKVIKKINDQHKSLAAAQIIQQKKWTNNNFGSLLFSNELNDIDHTSTELLQKNLLQMKKRPMKLEPLHLNHNK